MQQIKNELEKLTTVPPPPSTTIPPSAILPSEKFLETVGKGKKVSDLTLQQMAGMLTEFCSWVGIPASNFPAPEVMVSTVQAIGRNFGTMTDAELKKAFEMTAMGDLDCGEHFQTLSLKYISGVINAYRVKVNQAMRHYERQRVEPPTEQKEADWSETLEDLKKDPSLPIPASIFDWMVRKEILKPTNQEKLDAMRQADLEYRTALQRKIMAGYASAEDKKEYEQIHAGYGRRDAVYTKIANEAKKLLVKKYISQ